MYRNFINDTWEQFNKEIVGKKLFLFGLNRAEYLLTEMKKYSYQGGWEVCSILDNDERKHGKIKIGSREYDVLSPDILVNTNKENVIVLICGKYISEMAMQLEGIKVHSYFSDWWMSTDDQLKKGIYQQNVDETIAVKLKELMADEKSKEILDAVLKKRREGFIDYSDIVTGESEYFKDEFWIPSENKVFIDGGAYDGDTIEEYIQWVKGDYERIYSFEPQKNLAQKIQMKLPVYGERVSFFEKGLWSDNTTLKFTNGNNIISGFLDSEGKCCIETVALDNIIKEKVSFIKMDIEGAELEAIKGAAGILRRDRPNLAICIYHKPDDLWGIPFLIHEIVPEYRMYVRHCSISRFGTVLYCNTKNVREGHDINAL